MRPTYRLRSRRPSGFSILELLVVVGLMIVMAAVALPNIAGYIRQAKVRGAGQQVETEIARARNKAIAKNVNAGRFGGVVFAVLDANSYRYTVIDDNFAGQPATPPDPTGSRGLGPLRDLPSGVEFVPGSFAPDPSDIVFGIGFESMGRRCKLVPAGTTPLCSDLQTVATMCGDNDVRCNDKATGRFIDVDPNDASTVRVQMREQATGLIRTVFIQAGGKVMDGGIRQEQR